MAAPELWEGGRMIKYPNACVLPYVRYATDERHIWVERWGYRGLYIRMYFAEPDESRLDFCYEWFPGCHPNYSWRGLIAHIDEYRALRATERDI